MSASRLRTCSVRLSALVVLTSVLVAPGCDEVERLLGVPDVFFSVSDTTCASATVRWGDGSNDTELVVDLPWSRDIGSAPGIIVVLTARRECDDEGTITAQLRLDGDLEDARSASGPFAVAAVSASFF